MLGSVDVGEPWYRSGWFFFGLPFGIVIATDLLGEYGLRLDVEMLYIKYLI